MRDGGRAMLDLLREFKERTRHYPFEGSIVACALCGGTDHAVVGKRDRWLHPLTTVCCETCGLVFANPMPSAEEVEAYYRRDYRQHISGIDEPDPRYLMRARKGCRQRFCLCFAARPDSLDAAAGSKPARAVSNHAPQQEQPRGNTNHRIPGNSVRPEGEK